MTGLTALEASGFALVQAVARPAQIEILKAALSDGKISRVERGGQTYGARNLLGLAEVQDIARSSAISSLLHPIFKTGFKAVRGLFFDKTESANWPVQWHQDLALAVRARRDLPGWKNWSVKHGVTHVQPPAEFLDRMVTMRLHLDDCPAENGALRLVAGSHRHGQLTRDDIGKLAQIPAKTIVAEVGDALFMRPLILHASSPAETPSHRRVLHLEYAPTDLLPAELSWAEA